jgi:hypothetical protein
MENSNTISVCIKWIDNRKGIMCVNYHDGNENENENTFIIHRKNIVKPGKGKELKKLRKGNIISIKNDNKFENVIVTNNDTNNDTDNDEWCILS